jgi:preprotein translocase subunit SecG
MLFGFLTFGFVILCFILVLIIFLQKGKGSMGLGSLGGGSQMLFGGSGGQDIFQKVTWVLLALFMSSSLTLSIMKSRASSKYMNKVRAQFPTQEQARR